MLFWDFFSGSFSNKNNIIRDSNYSMVAMAYVFMPIALACISSILFEGCTRFCYNNIVLLQQVGPSAK